jgi:hypothetical protein
MIRRRPKLEPGDFVYVEWDDAYSLDEWTEKDKVQSDQPYLIKSVGILVEQNDNKIILALNHDTESDAVSCVMTIPFGMVKTLRKLK